MSTLKPAKNASDVSVRAEEMAIIFGQLRDFIKIGLGSVEVHDYKVADTTLRAFGRFLQDAETINASLIAYTGEKA